MPSDKRTVSGSTELANAPKNVPPLHPIIGNVIRPIKYVKVRGAILCIDTAKISSVIPNDMARRFSVPVFSSNLCERDKDISKYLKFIIRVANASSNNVPFDLIISIPANCPALVRLVSDIRTEDKTDNPPLFAIRPNAKETDM